ncbi:hypothetical protein Tco_0918431 [Tanacetum coccineum]
MVRDYGATIPTNIKVAARDNTGDGWTRVERRSKKVTRQPKSFEYSLNSITIDSHHITVNIARYQRNEPINTDTTKALPSHHHCAQPTTLPSRKTNIPKTKSYVETVTSQNPIKPLPAPPTPITIHSCPDLVTTLSHSLVGELATIDTFPNLQTLCDELDIPISKIKYLGGLHVLLELKPYTNSTYISSNKSLLSYFKTLTPWNSDFHLKIRLAWIAIEGLPPQAWHEAAFTHIAGEWGEVVFPEECNENNFNLVARKVCIRTKTMEDIHHNIPIIVDGTHICVRIRELPGECHEIWEPVKSTSKLNDDNASTNKTVNYSDEEDDDHEKLHDGSDYGLLDGEEEHRFLDAEEEHRFEGGWVKDDVVDDGNGENLKFSNVCSKHDDCLNSSIAEEANSKFPHNYGMRKMLLQGSLVKVRWNSRRGLEFTWEREDSFKQKYPQLFTNRASSSTTRS